jgi:hypothetical protein
VQRSSSTAFLFGQSSGAGSYPPGAHPDHGQSGHTISLPKSFDAHATDGFLWEQYSGRSREGAAAAGREQYSGSTRYKCREPGCLVRKEVDLRNPTCNYLRYEGKHNHLAPSQLPAQSTGAPRTA